MSESFDYVIVGAGSAGCVLANRLSANRQTSVLLLESGPPDTSFLIDMPRGLGKLVIPGGSHVSTYSASKGDGLVEPWMKGRALGGSSSVNGMVYVRGHPSDYDGWASMGCAGWDWSHMAPCFMELEDHELGAGKYRGVGGSLHVTLHPSGNKLHEAVINAFEQAGTPRVDDINDAVDGGVGYQPRNIWRGKRQSAAKAFLHPVSERSNLCVRTGTSVLKVLFDGKRACGVEVANTAGSYSILANKEIILSAGAIESPKLLQLSGVGDRILLSELGIPLIADSPDVGRNMQEQCYFPMQFRVTHGSLNSQFGGIRLLFGVLNYLLFKAGPMTYAAHEVGGFVKSRPELARPDLQFGVGLYSMKYTDKGFGIDDEPGMTMGGYLMRPESRGEIRIVSADATVQPVIATNFLAEESDRAAAVSVVRHIRKIAAQEALRPYITNETFPGAAVDSDEEIVSAILKQDIRSFHVSGTCRMGVDDQAVLDPELRVRGVEGLRVVDTSVFPTIPSGNTNAPAMAVALRASQIILAQGKGV